MAAGPDGKERRVYPVLFSWIADLPEKSLLCGVKQHCCPQCIVPRDRLDEPMTRFPRRSQEQTIATLREAHEAYILRGVKAGKAVRDRADIVDTSLFCEHWARSDIHAALHNDRTHELDIGVFGNHLLNGLRNLLEDDRPRSLEFHRRWAKAESFTGLKCFRKGILELRMVTGKDYRQMLRVSLRWRPLKQQIGITVTNREHEC